MPFCIVTLASEKVFIFTSNFLSQKHFKLIGGFEEPLKEFNSYDVGRHCGSGVLVVTVDCSVAVFEPIA